RPLRDQRGRMQAEEARSGASPEALEEFYRSLGALLRDAFAGWEAWILVAEGSPSRIMRLRPAHRYKLRNGSIPCELIGIPLYAERRDSRREGQGGEDDADS
ncbi:MAG: hypothetical protein VYD19_05160, partial [Myxococcota bacterium]|nr:hypothetical protein [Myxococcota bacterium]